jgi:ribosomal peptide maturation radical SAM protein 1
MPPHAHLGSVASRGSKLALISMPWHDPYLPSVQLGVLKAYVERELPDITVDTLHFYLKLEEIIGLDISQAISMSGSLLGEAVFACSLFPAKRATILDFIDEQKTAYPDLRDIDFVNQVIDPIAASMCRYAADTDWSQYLCIGFSLVFVQTAASLFMAKLIKQSVPTARILVGGPNSSGEIGMSLLRTFPQLDLMINGEGELPLTELVRRLLDGHATSLDDIPGVVSRNGEREAAGALSQLNAIESLPVPNYDSYFEDVDSSVMRSIIYPKVVLPVESSRGCWWDRSYREPMMSCSFCSLNLQWKGYREKSVEKFVAELVALSSRYNITRILLVDNILRYGDVSALCGKIRAAGKNFRIGIEARVSVTPAQMALLREAGVVYIQFGIEALSTEILKLINKGTTCIQNIQAMKFCERFGIESISNIITYHPGVRAEAIRETLRNMEFVTCYRPLRLSRFTLDYQSPVFKNPDAFGVSRIRNLETLSRCFPDEYCRDLFWGPKSFDADFTDEIDDLWTSVAGAIDEWQALYKERAESCNVPSLLLYEDKGTCLQITDYRFTSPRTIELDRISRKIYLTCEEVKDLASIQAACGEISDDAVARQLQRLVRERLMFCEGKRYLSLGIPSDPAIRVRYGPLDVAGSMPLPVLEESKMVAQKKLSRSLA